MLCPSHSCTPPHHAQTKPAGGGRGPGVWGARPPDGRGAVRLGAPKVRGHRGVQGRRPGGAPLPQCSLPSPGGTPPTAYSCSVLLALRTSVHNGQSQASLVSTQLGPPTALHAGKATQQASTRGSYEPSARAKLHTLRCGHSCPLVKETAGPSEAVQTSHYQAPPIHPADPSLLALCR